MTARLLLPGAEWVDLPDGLAGGPYDETAHPKGGVHTWEGLSWSAAESAFNRYPPHLAGKGPFDGVRLDEVGVHQYVSLDRHSYAFKGSENDDEFIVQVELAGRAAETHDPDIWTDRVLEWVAEAIVGPLERLMGIPPVIVPVGFHGADEGISPPLATTRSPIRLTDAELRAFSGWLGHQHMPPPDVHWDPGRFPMQRVLDMVRRTPNLEVLMDKAVIFTDTKSNAAVLADGVFASLDGDGVKVWRALAAAHPDLVVEAEPLTPKMFQKHRRDFGANVLFRQGDGPEKADQQAVADVLSGSLLAALVGAAPALAKAFTDAAGK